MTTKEATIAEFRRLKAEHAAAEWNLDLDEHAEWWSHYDDVLDTLHANGWYHEAADLVDQDERRSR